MISVVGHPDRIVASSAWCRAEMIRRTNLALKTSGNKRVEKIYLGRRSLSLPCRIQVEKPQV